MKSEVKFSTLGCRLNSYETESMRHLANTAGVNDAVVINTCAVTQQALANQGKKSGGCEEKTQIQH
jgi:threonylcarbamoyladenosine tRNA methylthiotransferase MtaB